MAFVAVVLDQIPLEQPPAGILEMLAHRQPGLLRVRPGNGLANGLVFGLNDRKPQGNRTWNATAHFATVRGFAAGQTRPQALKFDPRQALGGWKNPSAIALPKAAFSFDAMTGYA